MNYNSSGDSLLQYYGINSIKSIFFHSWEYFIHEDIDYPNVEKQILEASISKYFYLIISISLHSMMDRRKDLHELVEKRFEVSCMTVIQAEKNINGQFIREGVVLINRNQLSGLLQVLYALPFNTIALCLNDEAKKDDIDVISRIINLPYTIASICPVCISKGFEVLHIIRGNDGTSINLIQPNAQGTANGKWDKGRV